MGISNTNAALLFSAKLQGAKFDNSATLGSQTFWPFKRELGTMLEICGYKDSASDVFEKVGTSGSKFLKYLGANSVTEFDASNYEGAEVVHDMNIPLPEKWHGKFDFVFDGGSIEHIYNIPQVVANIDLMLKNGGFAAISTSGNNQTGHGFYQFSPEFFYRVFSKKNGWDIKFVVLVEHQKRPPVFWQVIDPELLGRRIEVQTNSQLLIMMLAKKTGNNLTFEIPQQSDYFSAWGNTSGENVKSVLTKPSFLLRLFNRFCWLCKQAKSKFFSTKIQPKTLIHRAKGLNQVGIQKIPLQEFVIKKF